MFSRIWSAVLVHTNGRGSWFQLSIQAWIDTWNQQPRPFLWTKTADEILDTIAHYCQRINNSGH